MKHKPSTDALDRALTDLYQADVPAGFRAAWQDAVKREEPSEMKSSNRFARLKRAALPLAAALVLIVGAAVTGILEQNDATSNQAAYDDAQPSYAAKTAGSVSTADYDMAADMAYEPAPSSTSSARGMEEAQDEQADTRKIVRTVSLTLTSVDFDQDYTTIVSLAQSAGGYASSVSLYETDRQKRAASFTLRIPAEQLDSFLGELSGIGRTTDRYETTTDMTTQYTDTAMRLQTQQDKMTRLQELLLKAEDMGDLLAIESEIADTQYEIDQLESSLRGIDRQVDYATVSVSLREQTPVDTAQAEDLLLGERLINSLTASLAWLGGFFENMLVFVIAAAPVLIGLGVLYFVVRVIIKRRGKHKQS